MLVTCSLLRGLCEGNIEVSTIFQSVLRGVNGLINACKEIVYA